MRSVSGKGTEAGRVCTPPHQVVMGTGIPARMAETGTVDSGMTEKETGIEAETTIEMATALTQHQEEGVAFYLTPICEELSCP